MQPYNAKYNQVQLEQYLREQNKLYIRPVRYKSHTWIAWIWQVRVVLQMSFFEFIEPFFQFQWHNYNLQFKYMSIHVTTAEKHYEKNCCCPLITLGYVVSSNLS